MNGKLKRKIGVACGALVLPLLGVAQTIPVEHYLMRPKTINEQVSIAWSYVPFNDFSNYFFENFFINLSDEAHSTDDLEPLLIKRLYQNESGKTHPLNWDDRGQGRWDGNYWERYQEMINLINSLLKDINTPDSELATALGGDSAATIDELRVLRAYYYLQAARLYGDFPIWENYNVDYEKGEQQIIVVNEDVSFPMNNVTPVFHSDLRRNPAAEVFQYIVSECQAAIASNLLPWHQTGDTCRMTQAIACAIMSQASLYGASPLFNGGQNLWQWAYETNKQAYELLSENGYELYSTLADSKSYLNAYMEYFSYNSHDGNTPTDKETIWGSPTMQRAEGLYVINGIPSTDGIFKAGSCPTQELIDAYDMLETGKPIYNLTQPYTDETKLNINLNEASGYDPQNPYEGRDPRFYANTYYNGLQYIPAILKKTVATWNNSDVEHWGTEGGQKGKDAIDVKIRQNTRTGYYNRKFHQFKPNKKTGGNWKVFRLGEVYLNYAEAAIEAGHLAEGLEMINAIRHRAGFAPEVDVTADTQDYARLLLRHERQVELAFEGIRYYDLRRWKTPGSDVTEEKYKTGMWLTSPDNGKTFEYHRFVIDPYKTGVTSEYYVAQNLLAPLSSNAIISLSNASEMPGSYWQNPAHSMPEQLNYTILSEDEKTCELTGCNYIAAADGSIVIPATVKLVNAAGESEAFTVTTIKENSFADCKLLTSVEIPATVTFIGEDAFKGCVNLASFTVAADNQNFCAIDGVLFTKDAATLINYPVKKEGKYEVPASVLMIATGAFANGTGLTSVKLEKTVAFIGSGAFADCVNLASVYYDCENPIEGSADIFTNAYDEATLYVPEDAVEKCKQIDPWKNFKNIKAYDFSGVEAIAAELNNNVEIYNLNGMKTGNSINGLTPGIYIIRNGNTVRKLIVK